MHHNIRTFPKPTKPKSQQHAKWITLTLQLTFLAWKEQQKVHVNKR